MRQERTPVETFLYSFLNEMPKTKGSLNKSVKALDELADTNYKQNRGTALVQIKAALQKLEALENMALTIKESL